MKTRESGMPEERTWAALFRPGETLAALGLRAHRATVVDLGCGYGTFAIPAAERVAGGVVHAFDIDPEMVAATRRKAERAGLANLVGHCGDLVTDGTGLDDACADFVMLFNLLHAAERDRLLAEALRVLRAGAVLAVMNWNPDPATPRGPSMAIRPRPDDCRRWLVEAGFALRSPELDLPPHHYGIVAWKPPGGGKPAPRG